MQALAATISAPTDLGRDRVWLETAEWRWSAGATTADEFAMQAVGRLLLQDIAAAPARRRAATASAPASARCHDRGPATRRRRRHD